VEKYYFYNIKKSSKSSMFVLVVFKLKLLCILVLYIIKLCNLKMTEVFIKRYIIFDLYISERKTHLMKQFYKILS